MDGWKGEMKVQKEEELTWGGGGLRGCAEVQRARLRLALLVLGHHRHVILSVPVQVSEEDVSTCARDTDLVFPGQILSLY